MMAARRYDEPPNGLIDFDEINAAALARFPDLLAEWLPGGSIHGAEYQCSDATGGPGHSFSVNVPTGVWKEFAGGPGGADPVSLYAHIRGLNMGDAARQLVAELGIDADGKGSSTADRRNFSEVKKSSTWKPIVPVPEDAPPPPETHFRLGKYRLRWRYTKNGRLWGYTARFDKATTRPNGKPEKEVLPLVFCEDESGRRSWRWQALPEPRLLYGLDRLERAVVDTPAAVVEGEKACDAAQALAGDKFVFVTWPGGSGAAEKADWSPLKGRRVLIWPDADMPGFKCAIAVARVLDGIASSISILVPDSAHPDGWDLADAEGWDRTRLFNEIAACKRDRESFLLTAKERYGIEAARIVEPVTDDGADWLNPVFFDHAEAPEIPFEALPETMGSYCKELAKSIQSAFALGVLATVGAIAAASQGKYRVVVRPGYTEPLCLYILAAMNPAERKSIVTSECKRPLIDWEAEQWRIYGPEVKRLQSERDTKLKAVEKERAKATQENLGATVRTVQEMEADIPEVPEIPRLLLDDVTPEEMAVFMSRHGDKAAIIEAEGGIFEVLTGLYSNGRTNLNLLLKSWSEEPVTVDRRTRETIRLRHPLLTLCLIVQPEVLRDISAKPGFRGKGVIGRFLYCIPKSNLGHRSIETMPVNETVAAQYRAMILRILGTPSAVNEFGEPCPYDLRLSDGAYRAWVSFAEHVERELVTGGTFENIRDWAGKLPGQAIRLAGIYHVAGDPEQAAQRPISEATMRQALTLAAVLADHALMAFDYMGADPTVECAKRIWRWVEDTRPATFTARDAYQAVKGSYPKMDQVTAGLKMLEDRAYIRQVVEKGRPGPGRKPSPVFEVNPLAHNSHNSHN